jgi:hypothetical protein
MNERSYKDRSHSQKLTRGRKERRKKGEQGEKWKRKPPDCLTVGRGGEKS